MWYEQEVRVQKALVLGRAVFIGLHMLINSANFWGQGPAPASASLAKAQEQCVAATVIRAKHKGSTRHLLLMETEGWDVIFSLTLESESRALCRMCHTAHLGQDYLGLICFVFEFHCDCCSLGAVLEGWLSGLVRIGLSCAQPCTSSRVNSPRAHHTPADAGSLLLH